jgi:DNA (cytosine-5)-methyltransferase 1
VAGGTASDGDLFGGDGLAPWLSMADGLGWGFTDRPTPTVTAGGTEQGGVEVFGNAGTRRRLREVVKLHTNRDQRPDGTRQVIDPSARPAPTLTAKSGGQWELRQEGGASIRVSVEDAAALQSLLDELEATA